MHIYIHLHRNFAPFIILHRKGRPKCREGSKCERLTHTAVRKATLHAFIERTRKKHTVFVYRWSDEHVAWGALLRSDYTICHVYIKLRNPRREIRSRIWKNRTIIRPWIQTRIDSSFRFLCSCSKSGGGSRGGQAVKLAGRNPDMKRRRGIAVRHIPRDIVLKSSQILFIVCPSSRRRIWFVDRFEKKIADVCRANESATGG